MEKYILQELIFKLEKEISTTNNYKLLEMQKALTLYEDIKKQISLLENKNIKKTSKQLKLEIHKLLEGVEVRKADDILRDVLSKIKEMSKVVSPTLEYEKYEFVKTETGWVQEIVETK